MSSRSPSSIKSFYRANDSHSTSRKRKLDSSNQSHSFKIPRSVDHGTDVATSGNDEVSLAKELSPVGGISTPAPGTSPFGINSPRDPAKARLFKIFFLKSQDSDVIRSAYNSLSFEMFNPLWIDVSDIDALISLQENPVIVLDSFESREFSLLKSKKSLKIFSAFALLQINPRKSEDLTSFEHSHIASICMKKVSLTFSGISDHSVVSEIRRKVRSMGGTFKPALYAKTTHIVATNWNSEKVKCFRMANKPVMLPEWVFRCWEKREDIDIQDLDDFALPVFSGMNICVSGFDQQYRTKLKQKVVTNGGNWHSGLLLNRYKFDNENTQSPRIDHSKQTTHLVVASKTGEKYKSAMSDPDVKIVNIYWINISLIFGIPQMEDDPRYCWKS